MKRRAHHYAATTKWVGRDGSEPWDYSTYSRSYTISVAGKPDLSGSATPAFHGDPDRHDPEDLFLAAISSCHMLSYLGLCARAGVEVFQYTDEARGVLELDADGGGRFIEVELRPIVTVAQDADHALAEALHKRAHELCFIANSCRSTILCKPHVTTPTSGSGEDQ